MNDQNRDIEALKRAALEKKVKALLQERKRLQPKQESSIPLADRRNPLPLSFAQQRLWFLCQLDPAASQAYHIPATLKLDGQLNHRRLINAFNALIARQESLRTRFVIIDGRPYQHIDPIDTPFAFDYHDLRTFTGEALEQRVAALSTAEQNTPFDLNKGPLFRGTLLQLTDEEHILILTQHHIISDGWSIGVLVHELGLLYQAACLGNPPPLNALSVQYADYANWQQQAFNDDARTVEINFWKQQLQGAPALLTLPTDRPRPKVQSYTGGYVMVEMDHTLLDSLKSLSKRHGTTLFMTLFAGWALVLSRLSGQQDLVIGTPVANRPQRELEGLIGFFVNTLALRVQLDHCTCVSDLLAEVRKQSLASYAHQDLPFDKVVEALQPARSLSYSPLFQVMLALNNTPAKHLELSGLNLSLIEKQQSSAHFDLTLSLTEEAGGLIGDLEYASDLFDSSTAERIVSYLIQVLTEMARDDKQPLAALPMLPAAEYQQVIMDFNATQYDFPHHQTVHRLFEQQVLRTPQALAVVSDQESLSYQELNRRANRLAHQLLALGVKPDDRVALYLERSPESLIAMLGILKAGAAYLPLDPAAPPARLSFMLEDAAPVALVTQRALDKLNSQLPTVLLDDPEFTQAPLAETDPDSSAMGLTSSHLAYVIYTSGSTGNPKGVMVEHKNVNRLVFNQRTAHLNAEDCVAHCANIAFDASTWEIWPALLNGARVQIISPALLRDPKAFCAALLNAKVSALWLTVGLFNQYLEDLKPLLGQLRYLLVGGDVLDPRKIQQLQQMADQPQHLLNGYGPTETTTFAATYAITAPVSGTRSIPIGRPISNTRIYILDQHGKPVPVGVPGEIYIAGAGVARGYLNQPQLTAERFLADPFSAEAGQRMYRSGDLGRWLTDGTIEYLGRNDFQVKIRGFRIELGEIEEALSQCDGVREAVVIANQENSGDKRLVAYLLAEEGCHPEPAELREQLAQFLAEYMLPTAYVLLDAFPLTANGKLDRTALPAPEPATRVARHYVAPNDKKERTLAALWSELLGAEQIGRHDNFFELGGHSLMVVSLLERLRQQGWGLEISHAYAAPELAEMARHLKPQSDEDLEAIPPVLIPDACTAITPEMLPLVSLTQQEIDIVVDSVAGGAPNVQDIYPLSALQEGILFHHLLQEHGDTYLLHSLLAFDNKAQLDGFTQALQQVIDRHDILRSAACWQGLPCPVQVVWRQAELKVKPFDPVGEEPIIDQLRAHVNPRQRRISLQQAPLFTADIVQDPQTQRWLLALCFHHIVCDHITMALICDEITQILQGQGAILPPPLPYRDFIARALQVPEAVHEAYFRNQLAHIESPTAPFDLLDIQESGGRTGEASLSLEASLGDRIYAGARRLGVSPGVLFHTACARLLALLCGREEVVFGTVLMGRLQAGTHAESCLGLFINTLPLRISLAGKNAREAIQTTGEQLTALLQHEQAPLALALRCSSVAPPLPLFSTLLNYRHSHSDGGTGSWQGMQLLEAEERTNYPITFSVDDMGNGFLLKAQTIADIEPAKMLDYFHGAITSLLTALESEQHSPLLNLSMLPAAERQQLLAFNSPPTDFPKQGLIHTLFEEQVIRTPEALALVFEEGSLTYHELNCRANQLAHRLLALGVKPDSRVALCMERGPDIMVAILGILKAGGAYLPLDPASPTGRLNFVLDDAAPVAVVTHSTLHHRFNTSLPKVLLDEPLLATAPEDECNPDPHRLGLTSSHLAYIIYTSGSTGQPKGVMVEHNNVMNLHSAMNKQLDLPRPSLITMNASVIFDASVQCWTQLLSGHRLLLIPEAIRKQGERLLPFLIKHQADVVDCTPVQLQWLLDAGLGKSSDHPHTVLVGGDALSVSAWQTMQERKYTRFINVYGPTETTVNASWCVIDAAINRPNIGKPLPNTRIYLLDNQQQPVPIGVPGELYIAGAGVARGYLNLPELTAERFLDDPFASEPGQRMYRSGDLGRWLPDGNIDYLGRNDFQVKIRGFRIELGEIEACLVGCDSVREAVVIAREESEGDKRLVAYLLPEQGCQPEPSALRLQLSQSLADYMLPSAFVLLEAFPLTPNGKLDRRALPAPDRSALVSEEYVAPIGDTEKALAAIWSELLGVAQVGRFDNFFELGGHSLIAVQLLTRMAKIGLNTPLSTLFADPRLYKLAEALNQTSDQPDDPLAENPVLLSRNGDQAPLFLLHEPSGDPLVYTALAEKLKVDRPIYALQALGIHESPEAPESLEALASYHIDAICRVQPKGPYYLAGWSLGGVISYEIAYQLQKRGEKVAFIGMIDSYNPILGKGAEFDRQSPDKIRDHLIISFVSSFVPDEMQSKLQEVPRPVDLKQLFELSLEHQWLPADISYQDLKLRLDTALYIRGLGLKYVPPACDLTIDLYSAETEENEDPWRGWQEIVKNNSALHAIGGTHYSIMRMPLLDTLTQKIGVKLLQHRTYSPLVPIRTGSKSQAPIFCIPGAGASAFSFLELVNSLEIDASFYALQARGLSNQTLTPHLSIEETARDYIKAMRQVAPSGPYRIMGHSFGGWIAFEIALQLQSQGETLAEVIIIDSRAPGTLITDQPSVTPLETMLKLISLYNQRLDSALPVTKNRLLELSPTERTELLHQQLIEAGIFTANTAISFLEGILTVMEANLNTHYRPQGRYQGKVRLVNAAEADPVEREKREQRWREYCSELTVVTVPGNHMTVLTLPHVRKLAEHCFPLAPLNGLKGQ